MENTTYGGNGMAYEEILTTNSSIQSKRATKTVVDSSDTVLLDGELLVVKTDGRPNIRVGNGADAIKNLKDVVPGEASTSEGGLMSASDKTKLNGIATGANKTTIDSALSSTSTNPVQNKVINTALANKSNTSHTHSDYLPKACGTITGALTTKGIKLTSGTDYGTTLPSSPATNQLFFQTVTSNFVLDNVYPVGAVYIAMNNTDPGTLFGGTWQRINNYFLWACESGGTIGATGGEQTVALTMNQMPKHDGHLSSGVMNPDGNPIEHGNFAGFIDKNVFTSYGSKGRGWNVFDGNEMHPASQNQGGGSLSEGQAEAHNNMPPYIQVAMWYRTA